MATLQQRACVAKVSGIKSKVHTGPARVFDSEEDALDAILKDRIRAGDILVIRYEGPKGGPGYERKCWRRHRPSSAKVWATAWGLITDGRFSGGTYGLVVGHVAPEAAIGGAIALVQEGDGITIDADKRLLQVNIDDEELAKRRSAWRPAAAQTKRCYGQIRKTGYQRQHWRRDLLSRGYEVSAIRGRVNPRLSRMAITGAGDGRLNFALLYR